MPLDTVPVEEANRGDSGGDELAELGSGERRAFLCVAAMHLLSRKTIYMPPRFAEILEHLSVEKMSTHELLKL